MNTSTLNENMILQLANRVLQQIQKSMFIEYRFLEHAIYILKPEAGASLYGTNGIQLFYNATELLNSYYNAPEAEHRRMLHSIFHCIYKHPFTLAPVNHKIWNFACDIVVEASILEQLITNKLGLKARLSLPDDDDKRAFISNLRIECKQFYVREIYAYLLNHPTLVNNYINLFSLDHHYWLDPQVPTNAATASQKKASNKKDNKSKDAKSKDENSQKQQNPNPNNTNDSEDDQNSDDQNGDAQSNGDDQNGDDQNGDSQSNSDDQNGDDQNGDAQSNSDDQNGDDQNEDGQINSDDQNEDGQSNDDQSNAQSSAPSQSRQSAQQQAMNRWHNAAQHVLVDMQCFHQQGTTPGTIEQTLSYLQRDNVDYTEFLQQFAVMEEVVKLDPDEFDYMYYMYGLDYCKTLPDPTPILLVEPLEYREEKRVRTFIIAIDTSGSTSDKLVQQFLNKTYSILKSSESFASCVDIHIIQCDAKVQEDVAIKSIAELELFAKNFKIKGLGGTDFRPVFTYVENLRNQGELKDLCGLLYFTDGFGTYPDHPTDYKTAFVFIDDYSDKGVPDWASRVYLTKETINEH